MWPKLGKAGKTMIIDPPGLNNQESSHLLTDIVIPRPIAWVATVDARGIFNLAPFSAYGMVSTKPMIVGFSVATDRNGKKKDTLNNAEWAGDFVIALVTDALAEAMNITAAGWPSDVSEFKMAKLTPVKADLVKAPLVAESPLNMECRVHRILPFGEMPSMYHFIMGEVLRVHINDAFYDTKKKRLSGLRAIGRLGGEQDLYCHGRDTFEMKRPVL
jgi:flavin reductase (DIM6/NTAB) family NADH-FMN oxidoreductase RutF